jgi:hypothetical protein
MMKGGVGNNKVSAKATGIRVQQSVYGATIPVIYGCARVSPSPIWVNGFAATPVSSGKKGAGSKKGGGGSSQLYDYTCACDFLLGHVPIQNILVTWSNKDVYGPVLTAGGVTLTVSGGQVTLPQSPYHVLYVALIEPFTASFDDYGSPGGEIVSGQWNHPLWNDLQYLPNSAQAGSTLAPYTYRWQPGMGTQVLINGGASTWNGCQVVVVYYTDGGNTAQAKLNLQFEPYLASGSEYTNYPTQQVAYTAFAGVGSPKFDLGQANMFPTLSFECIGAFAGQGDNALDTVYDCNPADIVTDIVMSGPLTLAASPYAGQRMLIGHGLNINSYGDSGAPVSAGSFLGDLTAMRNYCRAYGIAVSLVMDTQQAARQWLQELFDVANCAPVWSGAQLKAIPYCEVSAAGSGAVFTAPTAGGPVCNLDDSAFLIDATNPPVTVDRTRQADAYNVLPIEHLDRDNQYNTAITTEVEQRSVHQFGARKGDSQQMHSITTKLVAQKVASVLVKRSAMQRNTYSFKLPVTYSFLEAMDLVAITDLRLGLLQRPVRLTAVKESWDDTKGWTLDCQAEQFIYGLNEPTPMELQTTNPYALTANQPGGNVNAPVILEPTQQLSADPELWFVVSGSNLNFGGCMVFMSLDGGNSYQSVGACTKATTGVLTADYPLGSDPDSSDTLAVNLTESAGTLQSEVQAIANTYTNPYYLAGASGYEVVCPTTATLTSANHYNLTGYIRRGALASKPMDHPSGSRFAALDSSVLGIALSPAWIGQTLHFKFASYNQFGSGMQPLSECTDYTYTPTGVWKAISKLAVIQGTTSVIVPSGSGQVLYQLAIPANTLGVGDGIRIKLVATVSGSPNNGELGVSLVLGSAAGLGQTMDGGPNPLLAFYGGAATAEYTLLRTAAAGGWWLGYNIHQQSNTLQPIYIGAFGGSSPSNINWAADQVLSAIVATTQPGGYNVQGLSFAADFVTQPAT